MQNKILIIGQAPPAVPQEFPYDTTMLYEMFSWVGVTKERAQEIFEFEAVYDKFPGHGAAGHLQPSKDNMIAHWKDTLAAKCISADRILVLGNVAKEFLYTRIDIDWTDKMFVSMIHPSRRNQGNILMQRDSITAKLNGLLKDIPR